MKGIILFVILLFFSGPSFSTEEGPVVWLFAAQPERYFSAFLEIHLKRLVSGSQLQTINLYSKNPGELEKKINPKICLAQVIILMDFSEELTDVFFQKCENIEFHEKPFLITWNCGLTNLPDYFHSIPITINWELVLEELQTILSGYQSPAFIVHHNESYIQDFLLYLHNHSQYHLIVNDKKPCQSLSSQQVYLTSCEDIMKEYLSLSHQIICFESSTLALAEIQAGHILAAIDFKPSQLATQISDLFSNKANTPNLSLAPLLIFPESLSEADAYEVLGRCFMCK
ncbi:MAG: hypothetical protein GX428_12470 [Candidatus Atribacteria bacterium]|nr:hypothetical protein [Candidatus Atribacteria bacterium]